MSAVTVDNYDFVGVIERRDADGFGVVRFDAPNNIGYSGVFTREVLQNPEVANKCRVGAKVVGRVRKERAGYRVVKIEPSNK